MKNSIQKKHILIVVAIAGIITLCCIGGVIVYSNKKEYAIRSEALKIKAEIDSWQQWVNTIKISLEPGATGKEVALLQKILARDESNETIYPEKKITGYYKDTTKTAVEKFQETHGLPQTGNVDEPTRKEINKIAAKYLCPKQVIMYPDFLLKKVTKQETPLPANYVPPALEEISGKVKTLNKVCVRAGIVPNIEHMFQDAKKDGVHLMVTSGYRGYKMQEFLYEYWHKKYGNKAKDLIAEPGKSEHQLGTTIDITDASINYDAISEQFAKSDGGIWMRNNAHKYGFIMSYPEEKKYITGYHYEPWHWRFVGIATAKALYRKGEMFNTTVTHTQKKPFPASRSGEGLTLSAGAALTMFVDAKNNEYVLVQKNSTQRIPIASITKLMTALIAVETLQPDTRILISWDVLTGKGVSGKFIAGEIVSLKDALHAILIESNNEIAIAIAKTIGTESFIKKMNDRAHELKMYDTHFVNVTGLDPEEGSENMNYASALDVANLLHYIFTNEEDIFATLKKQEYTIITNNTNRAVPIQTTNELLGNQKMSLQVMGGKTGTTPKAKSNLTTIAETPLQKGHIITVILNSKNAFNDTQDLLQYLKKAFVW